MMWIEPRNKLKIIFDDQTRYLFQLQGISLYILYKEWIIAITQVIFKMLERFKLRRKICRNLLVILE